MNKEEYLQPYQKFIEKLAKEFRESLKEQFLLKKYFANISDITLIQDIIIVIYDKLEKIEKKIEDLEIKIRS